MQIVQWSCVRHIGFVSVVLRKHYPIPLVGHDIASRPQCEITISKLSVSAKQNYLSF